MNSKWVIATALLVLVIGGAFLLLKTNNSATNTTPQAVTQTPTQETSESISKSPTQAALEVQIALTAQGFSPKTLTVKKGTKVVWTNESGQNATVNSDPHPIHTGYQPLNLGNFGDGEKLELIFTETGTFGYHNHLNSSERGTIVVE